MLFLAFVVLLPIASTFAYSIIPKFEQLVVYGDSVTDNGNVYRATNKTYPASPPYYQGRFSDGPVWLEYVSQYLSIPVQDNGYGGATTNADDMTAIRNNFTVPGFIQQVETIHVNTAETLYMVEIGGNDLIGLLYPGAFFDDHYPNYDIHRISDNLIQGIQLLINKYQAQDIVLMNIPSLDVFPGIEQKLKKQAAQLVIDYNQLVKDKIQSIKGARIQIFDFYSWVQQQMQKAKQYNMITDTACYDDVTSCNTPGNYFFWDTFHFETKVHKALSVSILKMLKSNYKIKSKVAFIHQPKHL
ncbi:GDSL lipase/esterase [Gilbertella persicaria]|uniref:GDSL lipase/esterase n=1 Tax=Gilbertella persicaria TaxID=101096 RepID=UPI00221F6462|nr:GDSL lipase/esterase [Gilbertella persicaria]KAI8079700.1 GDSL lipase/esterase [Gilbertella persicaria]